MKATPPIGDRSLRLQILKRFFFCTKAAAAGPGKAACCEEPDSSEPQRRLSHFPARSIPRQGHFPRPRGPLVALGQPFAERVTRGRALPGAAPPTAGRPGIAEPEPEGRSPVARRRPPHAPRCIPAPGLRNRGGRGALRPGEPESLRQGSKCTGCWRPRPALSPRRTPRLRLAGTSSLQLPGPWHGFHRQWSGGGGDLQLQMGVSEV